MLKTLALVFGIALLFANGPNKQAAKQDKDAGDVPAPSTTIVDNSIRQDDQKRPAERAPESHAGIEWSNWMLVLIAGVTGWAIWRQASESTNATKAMRRSIEVQEAEFFQWVDIGEWKVEKNPDIHWVRVNDKIQHSGPLKVRISFPLLNNTTRPLSVNSVQIVLEIGSEKTLRKFVLGENMQVPPRGEYSVVIDTTLTDNHAMQYITLTLFILGAVQVRFSNALGNPDGVAFRRLVASRADEGTRTVSQGHKAEEVEG
jgi:hypothetical protein